MAETEKARARRAEEGFFRMYCNGRGIDIGCGNDPIDIQVDRWDKEQGDATFMESVPDNRYDFVYCLEEGTVVVTKDGLKPIEFVTRGDYVWTHRRRWKMVTANQRFENPGNLIRLVSSGNSDGIRCSKNHPILAVHYPNRSCGQFDRRMYEKAALGEKSSCFVRADNLSSLHCSVCPIPDYVSPENEVDIYSLLPNTKLASIYDAVMEYKKRNPRVGDKSIARVFQISRSQIRAWIYHGKMPFGYYLRDETIRYHGTNCDAEFPRTIKIGPQLMRLIGYYLSDGSLSSNGHQVAFHFSTEEMDYIEDVKGIIWNVFRIKPTDVRRASNGGKGLNLRYCSVPLWDYMTALVGTHKTHHKRIPPWALWAVPEFQADLIEGLFRGDGTYSAGSGMSISTVSKLLVEGIRLVLLRLGVFVNIRIHRYERPIQGSKFRGCGHLYSAFWTPKRKLQRGGIVQDSTIVSRVIRIDDDSQVVSVHGLKVDDDESYFACGIMNHNSSHCLEHLDSPHIALQNWLRICKPGGYLIIFIPHRDLYEKRFILPSRWNADHRTFWLPDRSEPPCTIGLVPFIAQWLKGYEFVYCKTCDAGHTITDPNLHSDGEYSIECVIRKT